MTICKNTALFEFAEISNMLGQMAVLLLFVNYYKYILICLLH